MDLTNAKVGDKVIAVVFSRKIATVITYVGRKWVRVRATASSFARDDGHMKDYSQNYLTTQERIDAVDVVGKATRDLQDLGIEVAGRVPPAKRVALLEAARAILAS